MKQLYSYKMNNVKYYIENYINVKSYVLIPLQHLMEILVLEPDLSFST